MKKMATLGLSGSFIGIFAAVLTAFGQDAGEIVEKMITAQGGRQSLEKVEDRTLTGTIDMVQMGTSGSVSTYQKKPDKMRMEFEMMGMMVTQAYDGTTAWGVDPQTGETREMPERAAKSFKRQALSMEALLHPEAYGIKYTYAGKDKVEGKDCHVLEESFSDGYKVKLYIDAGTYLPLKVSSKDLNQMGAEVTSETFYGDYKKVEGMTVPHRLTIFQDGQEFMKVTVAEVVFNSGLEDSLFKMEQ